MSRPIPDNQCARDVDGYYFSRGKGKDKVTLMVEEEPELAQEVRLGREEDHDVQELAVELDDGEVERNLRWSLQSLVSSWTAQR